MTNDTKGQVDTAYHEAGHAVIGRVLGLTRGRVSIVPNRRERTAGYSIANVDRSVEDWRARGREDRSVQMHRARIMMLQAGREAEIVCLGHCRGGDGDDLREIERTLSEAKAPDDPDAWLERRRNKTRERVRRHRRVIERVAAELLEHGRLPARRIDTIMRQEGVRVISRTNPERVPDEVKLARAVEWETGRKVRYKFRPG